MVATTKGPVNAPGGHDTNPEERTDDDDRQARGSLDLDDATWGQVMAQAQSQQSTPAAVVRRLVENAFGVAPQSGAYHSGQADDPALTNAKPEERPAEVGAPSHKPTDMTDSSAENERFEEARKADTKPADKPRKNGATKATSKKK